METYISYEEQHGTIDLMENASWFANGSSLKKTENSLNGMHIFFAVSWYYFIIEESRIYGIQSLKNIKNTSINMSNAGMRNSRKQPILAHIQ